VSRALRQSFDSLSVPNYRRYFTGQVVSLTGNWVQTVAEVWLVLSLTGSGTAVGLLAAAQWGPMLVLAAAGGLLADRFPKRRLLMLTQVAMAAPVVSLWALTSTGAVEVWMVYALVLVRGTVNAVDYPTRQSFVMEMVGPARVVNAVSLNSVLVHVARIAGPAIAAVLIAVRGVEPAFLLNALSFVAMLVALRRMDPAALATVVRAPREPRALRAGVAYVRRTPELRIPLMMMALVGTLSFNFQVILPLFASFTFDGGASAYAALMTAMGAGSVVGALVTGARGRVSPRLLVVSAAAFGALTLATAGAPSLVVAAALLVPLGAASVTFAASVNSSLQLAVEPVMRGRVMALYAVVFVGSTPLGAPLAGWLSEAVSPRVALALGGLAALAAAAGATAAFARMQQRCQGPNSHTGPRMNKRCQGPNSHPATKVPGTELSSRPRRAGGRPSRALPRERLTNGRNGPKRGRSAVQS